MATPPILLNLILDVLIEAIRQVREIDGIQGRKDEVQASWFYAQKISKGSMHHKSPTANEYVQQNSRIKNKHTKISSLSVCK